MSHCQHLILELQCATHIKMKNHFHSVSSKKVPKKSAPKYPPVGADAANKPRLRFRIRPGGLVLAIIATALGIIKAPPKPLRARIVTKAKKFVQKAQTSVQILSHAPPARRSSRWPKTSPSRPLTNTKVPYVSLVSMLVPSLWRAMFMIGYLTHNSRRSMRHEIL